MPFWPYALDKNSPLDTTITSYDLLTPYLAEVKGNLELLFQGVNGEETLCDTALFR